MNNSKILARGSVILGLVVMASGCIVAPRGGGPGYHEGYREGYYDREHRRYWHERAWHECVERDEHCR